MRRFTDAGRQAIDAGNLYAGLSLALMLPEICASLEDPGPGKSQKRYEGWCRIWLQPKFTHRIGIGKDEHVFLSAEDCFQLRCSLIHSGSVEIAANKVNQLNRFEFFDRDTGSHMNLFGSTVINGKEVGGFLQLKADKFSETIFETADEWDAAKANDQKVQDEKKKLLTIRSKGFSIGGGAIVFG
jgi:hypothetical protein